MGCPTCQDAAFPADAVLGLDGSFTRRARRQICHAGVFDFFERGESTLRELAGWSVDVETVPRLCHAEAAECRATGSERLDRAKNFKQALGNWELQIDAGKVNTETGWRDVTGARWKAEHIGPFVALISLGHGQEWEADWSAAAMPCQLRMEHPGCLVGVAPV